MSWASEKAYAAWNEWPDEGTVIRVLERTIRETIEECARQCDDEAFASSAAQRCKARILALLEEG